MFSRFHKALKILAVLFLVVVAAGIGAPYFGADYFQTRIEHALESALGRKVAIQKTHYNVFTGPGFTIDNVVIEEDPRIGIEAFAKVLQVDARIDWLSLLTGKMEFSSLRLVEPEINFARSEDGVWNMQLFLDRAPAKTLPPISIRAGHLHVKIGDRKSTIYLGDTDAEINHSSDGRVRVALTGEAYRSDRQAQGLARLALRGNYQPATSGPGRVELDFELERSQVQDIVKLFDARDLGLKGFAESQAHLSGPIDNVAVRGQFKTSELASRLFLPSAASGALPYEGKINFVDARAEISTVPANNGPLAIRLAASNFLRDPDWAAEMNLRELTVPAALELAKNFGITLPAGMDVTGKLQGELKFNKTDGANGEFELVDGVIQLPSGGKLDGEALQFEVQGKGVRLRLHTPVPETASKLDVEGHYDLESKTTALAVTSRGMKIADTRKMFGALPLLEHFLDGVWRGTLKYVAPGDKEPAAWNGQIEVAQARVDVPGIEGPVTLSFPATIEGSRAVVRTFKGTVGTIAVAGNYRYEPSALRPHRVNVVVPVASLAEIEKIFRPTLMRSGGLLARTLRFGRAPVPDWLRERRLEGTVSIGSMQAGEWTCKSAQARILWNGTTVTLAAITGTLEDAAIAGEVVVDLTGPAPAYTATGTLGQLEYRGGQLGLKGKLTSQGAGDQVVSNARAEGTFEAKEIRFSPESLLDHATGTFELVFPGGVPKTKLTNVEVSQGSETYQGQGGTQTDGRVMLELSSGPKQLKVIGTLLAAPAVP